MMQRWQSAGVRTTIDLPDDLHELARQLARDANRSMSEVVVESIRLGLRRERIAVEQTTSGMPVVSIGRPVTVEDVRSLDEE